MTKTLLVPCALRPTMAVLESGAERGMARDDDTVGKEETGSGVEYPDMGAALELAGTTAEELIPIDLDEFARVLADELGRKSPEEIGVITGAKELDGLRTILVIVRVESIGGTSAVVLLAVVVAVEVVTAGVVVADTVVVEAVAEVAELVVTIELFVNNDVVLVAAV
jgi:hypothetical protein